MKIMTALDVESLLAHRVDKLFDKHIGVSFALLKEGFSCTSSELTAMKIPRRAVNIDFTCTILPGVDDSLACLP